MFLFRSSGFPLSCAWWLTTWIYSISKQSVNQRFIQTFVGCLGLLLLCGCSTAPVRVSVSAGTIASAPYPEICVVELQNGKKQFIQAVPDELSRTSRSAVIAYVPGTFGNLGINHKRFSMNRQCLALWRMLILTR